MKCLVCGKEFAGGECPRCKFPDLQFPGDRDEAIRSMKPVIDSFRAEFLKKVRVAVVIYRWKDRNGNVVPDREELLPIGTGAELSEGVRWLEQKFARIPEQQKLSLRLRVTAGEETENLTVTVPNPQIAELQQLGAELDPDLRICLLLRGGNAEPLKSAYVPIFA